MMNSTKTFILFSLLAGCLISFIACSKEDEYSEIEPDALPGIYRASITVYADKDEKDKKETRGIDVNRGEFTQTYTYNEIYIHSGDNSTTNHKVLKVPIDRVESCEDCLGVNLELEIKQEGGYIIRTRTGEYIELEDDETVYFSSYEKPFWKALVSHKNLPFNKKHEIYLEDKDLNRELLRSYYVHRRKKYYNFTKNKLQKILFEDLEPINLSRHSEGFRLFVMFSDINKSNENDYSMDSTIFYNYLDSLGIKELKTNIYIGPYFCPKYDMYEREPITGSHKEGGYYSSDNQHYRDFSKVLYSHTGGGDAVQYQGYGFQTKAEKFLLAPTIPVSDGDTNQQVNITCFIEATYKDGTKALKSFTEEIPGLKFEKDNALMHFVIMAFDYRDLKVFARPDLTTRNSKDTTYYEVVDLEPFSKLYIHN